MTPELLAKIDADLEDPGQASLRFSTLQQAWPQVRDALRAAWQKRDENWSLLQRSLQVASETRDAVIAVAIQRNQFKVRLAIARNVLQQVVNRGLHYPSCPAASRFGIGACDCWLGDVVAVLPKIADPVRPTE